MAITSFWFLCFFGIALILYYVIPRKYDVFDEAAFEAYGGEYTVVVTNVKTGKAEYMKMENFGFIQVT